MKPGPLLSTKADILALGSDLYQIATSTVPCHDPKVGGSDDEQVSRKRDEDHCSVQSWRVSWDQISRQKLGCVFLDRTKQNVEVMGLKQFLVRASTIKATRIFWSGVIPHLYRKVQDIQSSIHGHGDEAPRVCIYAYASSQASLYIGRPTQIEAEFR